MKLKINYASAVEIFEINHVAIIIKLIKDFNSSTLNEFKELIEVILAPFNNDYNVKVSNSGKALLINRSKAFATGMNIEQDFIILRRRYK